MIQFTAYGEPIPQGSMSAFVPKGWTRAIITSGNKRLKKWRNTVSLSARAALGSGEPAGRRVPLSVTAVFYLTPAKSNKFFDAVKKPDLDKLVRALLDSMSKILYHDDAQVVRIAASKDYGLPARVEVEVAEVLPPLAELARTPIRDSDIPF
jgi:crossover junction endodeoxyribonuclease RusA